jgi:hypothetical protein
MFGFSSINNDRSLLLGGGDTKDLRRGLTWGSGLPETSWTSMISQSVTKHEASWNGRVKQNAEMANTSCSGMYESITCKPRFRSKLRYDTACLKLLQHAELRLHGLERTVIPPQQFINYFLLTAVEP